MAEKNISKTLQKSIILYSALGIFATSWIVALASIVPLYARLQKDEERNLLFAVQTKALLVEQYLSRSKDIALQIASRTKAREKLEAYNQGKVSLNELVNFTQGILTDAFKQSREIAAISRFDRRGNLVIEIGIPLPQEFRSIAVNNTQKQRLAGNISIARQSYLVVVTPIIDKSSKQVGTDIVLFKTSGLQQIVKDRRGLGETGETVLGGQKNNQIKLLFPRRKQNEALANISKTSDMGVALQKAFDRESGILPTDASKEGAEAIAYAPIAGGKWAIAVKMDKSELYAPINAQITVTSSIIVVLILIGTYGMVRLLRPLAGKTVIHTDELEQQIGEKIAALQQSEAKFQKLTTNVPGIIYQFVLRPDGSASFPYVSPGCRELFELEPEQLQESATPAIEMIHPSDRESFYQTVGVSAQTLEPWQWEGRFILPSGKLKWLQGASRPQLQANGDILWDGLLMDITERKQTEEALGKSEQKLGIHFQQTPLAVIEWNLDFEVTEWNPAAERIFGYNKSEILGRHAVGLIIPESIKEQIDSVWQDILAGKGGHRNTNDNLTKSGKIITCEWYNTPLIDPKGEVIGVASLAQDITDRKQTETALMQRSHLSTLAADVGIALGQGGTLSEILQRCTEAIVVYLNAATSCIWTFNSGTNQLERQAFTGRQIHIKSFPKNIPLDSSTIIGNIAQNHQHYLTNDILNDAWMGNQAWVKREKLVAFAGYPLIVEDRLVGAIALWSRQSLPEAAHSTLGWVANSIAVAIDRAWAREELLGRRESLLFQLANQIRNSLDIDTILETTVQEIHNLLQIERCHFMWYRPYAETPSWELVKEAKDAGLPSLVGYYPVEKTKLSSEKFFNLEMLRVDNVKTLNDPAIQQFLSSIGYASVLALPIKTGTGKIGVISCSQSKEPRPWSESEVELLQAVMNQLAVAIDQAELYEQARASAKLAQDKALELEQTLQELQQTQSQLIQTEKMSSLGQLVAGVAHEINNPVNFIYGNLVHANEYIQDLLKLLHLYQEHYPEPVAKIREESEAVDVNFLSEDLPQLLASMKVGADRIRQIVLSLRNFSRLDEAEMKPVDLHEGIDSTLLILQHRLKIKSQNTEIQVIKDYGNLPPVECYPGQLNQVFMNVISNAIDALEEKNKSFGGAFIPTISIRTEVSHANCVIIRIADNGQGMPQSVKARIFDPFFTTKPVGKGTGLGLSISYQIVADKHGGILKCLSEPGQGTQFCIELPIQQAY